MKIYFNQRLKICLAILSLLCFKNISAQTQELVPLKYNSTIKQYLKDHPQENFRVSLLNSIELPFVDDFSNNSVFPDPTKWENNMVFINNDFPINPITVGVASFDGLDGNGNPYVVAVAGVGGCDTLTSQPINLFSKPASQGGAPYSLGDSLILSFYYEKRGLGDAPEVSDSLVLDFFNPSNNTWARQWFSKGGITGGQDTIFYKVTVKVSNAAFLQDGFKFRFRTYGARIGNLDMWHVDYVRLYAAYNSFSGVMDTVLTDVAYTQPGKSLLTGHTSIPWDHFTSLSAIDQQNLIDDSLKVNYRVNDNTPNDVGFNNRIFDFAGNYVAGFGQTNGNIFPGRPNNQNLTYTFGVDSIFPNTPSQTVDSTTFTILSYFSNGNAFSGLKSNDTIRYEQKFYNFYSYDDGTAEVAFDLANSPLGKLAMKFDILKPDTLRAVRFFFAQLGASVSNKLFTLKIWSSLSPETVIYQEINQKPSYINTINGYSTYVLDQIVPVSGTIYIGFQQIAADGLHLGFDRNTSSNTNMFFNTVGTWSPVTVAPGTFMIRPVMGDTSLFSGVNELALDKFIQLYPNPTSNNINIFVENPYEVTSLSIRTMEGRLVYQAGFSSTVDVSTLVSGLYFIELSFLDNSIARKRMIIVKD
jgi:hypothetical protein